METSRMMALPIGFLFSSNRSNWRRIYSILSYMLLIDELASKLILYSERLMFKYRNNINEKKYILFKLIDVVTVCLSSLDEQ